LPASKFVLEPFRRIVSKDSTVGPAYSSRLLAPVFFWNTKLINKRDRTLPILKGHLCIQTQLVDIGFGKLRERAVDVFPSSFRISSSQANGFAEQLFTELFVFIMVTFTVPNDGK